MADIKNEIPETEVKKCPFCGSVAKSGHFSARCKEDEYYLVMCVHCFARTVGDTEEEAINAWNKRVTEGV